LGIAGVRFLQAGCPSC